MNSRIIVIAMVFATAILMISPSASADSQDPPIIGFDFDNGLSANESITLTGSVELYSMPDSVDWIISSDHHNFDGSITDSLQELESLSERSKWSWQIDLEIDDYPVCTCYLTISASVGEWTWSETRVLFMGDTLRSGLIVDSPREGDWVHNSVDV